MFSSLTLTRPYSKMFASTRPNGPRKPIIVELLSQASNPRKSKLCSHVNSQTIIRKQNKTLQHFSFYVKHTTARPRFAVWSNKEETEKRHYTSTILVSDYPSNGTRTLRIVEILKNNAQTYYREQRWKASLTRRV